MAPPSLFQTLPMLLVEMTVEYLEGYPRNALDTDIDTNLYNEGKIDLTPLLWVSERWRRAALSSICNNCVLSYSGGPNEYKIKYPALPSCFSGSKYGFETLVRRVTVHSPSWSDICSGAFNGTLNQARHKCPIFSLATDIEVDIIGDEQQRYRDMRSTSEPRLPAKDKAVMGFARSLRQVTPAATRLMLSFMSANSTNKKNRGLCNILASQLCGKSVTRITVASFTECTLPHFKLHDVSGLTSIMQEVGMACAPFARLAYLNARTLKELGVICKLEEDWRVLIYGDIETPAVYSSLTSLILKAVDFPYGVTWSAIEDAVVPFPVLSRLDVCGGYPFDDDVLFRGNGGTLKRLCIPFCAIGRNALGRFNVLGRRGGGIGRMDLVDIGEENGADIAFATGQARSHIAQQLIGIMEVATKLRLGGDTPDRCFLNVVKSAPNTAVLRSLEIQEYPLDIFDIIKVVSALPTLESLACEIERLALDVNALSVIECPSALRAKHFPLSSNFRHIFLPFDYGYKGFHDSNDSDSFLPGEYLHHIGDFDEEDFEGFEHDYARYENEYYDYDDDYGGDDFEHNSFDDEEEEEVDNRASVNEIAVVAMHIAVLCPNFVHVEVPKEMRSEFSREIIWATSTAEFKPYADTIRRLIYPS
ncbi:hypothetical protein GGI00_001043 [Coemansia sp. RSA 2681]|nr:hypothetical protein GGI00_001043 [Coemansia sp. RSA 2681]